MGRIFYFSGYGTKDGWVDHADKVFKEGVNRDGIENCETVTQEAGTVDEAGNVNVKRRPMLKNAAIGIDSGDAHYMGDRVVITGENPQSNGDITLTFERYDDSGKFRGTYEQPWHLTREGGHRMGKARRVFGF